MSAQTSGDVIHRSTLKSHGTDGFNESEKRLLDQSVSRLTSNGTEALVILDVVEGRVDIVILVPDALDRGPHVHPIVIGPASGDETLISQPVVNRPLGWVLADV